MCNLPNAQPTLFLHSETVQALIQEVIIIAVIVLVLMLLAW